ncbi:MAG: GNAT family protein [Antarcticimicrobium sp.]|uniref:GNAT family N-acetyltransferase n=1 Tax=Antarcticimicrobium sp. TaxID=2824147 RepID=UPI002638CC0E|nr:GNAT family protein [Antarcticimicrobium sp.]MDF1716680.1 GNAT family protein [Antarcticimicrobium sp.]
MTGPDPARPLGSPVANRTPPSLPSGALLEGRFARLEPLSAEDHAALLFRAYAGHDALWDYMAYGPFHSAAQYHRWVRDTVANPDHLFYAICDKDSGICGGVASFLRIKPQMGVIEVGNIALSPALQRTRAATEAMALMMGWAFDAGYRRYEWKCDALNRPSRAAAQRLGFSFEGVFRQHMVIKGRNRDTAWFAVTDRDWPALREAFSAWLAPANFDSAGRQRERLGDLTRLVRVGSDPTL